MKILNLLKSAWLNYVIKTLIERIPGLKQIFKVLDGKKAIIGRVLLFIAAILTFFVSPEGFCKYFPSVCAENPLIEKTASSVLFLVGWILTELGLQHDSIKQAESESGESQDSEK